VADKPSEHGDSGGLDVQIYTAKTLFIHESYLLTCWWYKISSSPP
jgi:hypothetical protein